MLDSLTQRFSKVLAAIGGKKRLTESNVEDAMREVRTALIEADVALPVLKGFMARVKAKALGAELLASVTPGQMFVKILHDELVATLGGEGGEELRLDEPTKLTVVLFCGLQGSGKTTSVGKIARRLKAKRDVMVASLDTRRPAAEEQLRILAEQAGVECFLRNGETDAVKAASAAIVAAKAKVKNLLLLDTAGRTQVDEELLAELKEIHRVAKPIETILVADSMTGQRALDVARRFAEAVPVTGSLFTKFDSDTRGGAVLSVREAVGVPVRYIGTGESIAGLDLFVPSRIADRMLGMGDIVGLVEKAQEAFDLEKAQKLQEKLKKSDFDLEDFLEQLEQMSKLGSLGALAGMIPGMAGHADKIEKEATSKVPRMKAILQSMTREERRRPLLLGHNGRRVRIAKGSGTTVLEVGQLLKRFDEMKGMMRLSRNPSKMKQLFQKMGGRGEMPADLEAQLNELQSRLPAGALDQIRKS